MLNMVISMDITIFDLSKEWKNLLRLEIGDGNGVVWQGIDSQVVDTHFDLGTIGLCHRQDDIDAARVLESDGVGILDYRPDVVLNHFDLLKRKAFGYSQTFQQIRFLIYLKQAVGQIFQAIDGNGGQDKVMVGVIPGLIRNLLLEQSFFGEFVSGIDGLGGTFFRCQGQCGRAG